MLSVEEQKRRRLEKFGQAQAQAQATSTTGSTTAAVAQQAVPPKVVKRKPVTRQSLKKAQATSTTTGSGSGGGEGTEGEGGVGGDNSEGAEQG